MKKVLLFSAVVSLNRSSKVSGDNFAKAASVGANTVKFPAPTGKDPIAFSLFKNNFVVKHNLLNLLSSMMSVTFHYLVG